MQAAGSATQHTPPWQGADSKVTPSSWSLACNLTHALSFLMQHQTRITRDASSETHEQRLTQCQEVQDTDASDQVVEQGKAHHLASKERHTNLAPARKGTPTSTKQTIPIPQLLRPKKSKHTLSLAHSLPRTLSSSHTHTLVQEKSKAARGKQRERMAREQTPWGQRFREQRRGCRGSWWYAPIPEALTVTITLAIAIYDRGVYSDV